jgi:hypothetical protein
MASGLVAHTGPLRSREQAWGGCQWSTPPGAVVVGDDVLRYIVEQGPAAPVRCPSRQRSQASRLVTFALLRACGEHKRILRFVVKEDADDKRPAPPAAGRLVGDMALRRAVPVNDGARLRVRFVAPGLPAPRGQLAHVVRAIACECGVAAPPRNCDEVIAPVAVAERSPARRARQKTEQIVLRKIPIVDTQIHRRCSGYRKAGEAHDDMHTGVGVSATATHHQRRSRPESQRIDVRSEP